MTLSPLALTLLLAALALMLLAGAVLLLAGDASSARLERRVLAVTGLGPDDGGAGGPLGPLRALLHALGMRLQTGSSFYSRDDLLALEGAIGAVGLNPARVLPVVLGAKLMFTLLLPVIGLLYGWLSGYQGVRLLFPVLFAIPIGLLGPDIVLKLLRRPYNNALRRGLPDALDLLVVCTEAGMGLEQALGHVATEIANSNPAIAQALSKLLDELRVLPDRQVAFANFGQRSGVDGIRRLATMLGQTLQYGTPIAEALRFVASDLRRERMVTMEAKCVKLPSMLVLPLILFIMPALFIVLAASPMLRIVDMLGKMSHGAH